MSSVTLKIFASELKASRESKNISLHQVATRTKIDIKFLQAIEDGNFGILPDIYIRAFLKEYAQTIDLNVPDTIRKYELSKLGKVEEKADLDENEDEILKSSEMSVAKKEYDATETIVQSVKAEFDPKIVFNKVNFIIGSVVVLVIIIVLYLLFVSSSSSVIMTEKPTGEVLEGSNKRFEVDSVEIKKANYNFSDSLRLSVSATNRVWIKVLTDKKEVFQNIIQASQSLSFKAFKEFRVVVGNAGFVKLLFNNKPLNNLGNNGEIKNIIITADTIRSYLITIPAKNETESSAKN